MKQLLLVGDTITDVYCFYEETPKAKRLHMKKVLYSPGCADNVANNIDAILNHNKVDYYSDIYDADLQLVRHIKDDELIFETIDDGNDGLSLLMPLSPPELDTHGIREESCGLIVSDYNKGAVNREPLSYDPEKKFKFVLIDSRYGTVWPGYIGLTNCPILHVTGEEWNRHDTTKYKYVIHTNGPENVHIYREGNLIASLPVPNTKVVDATGAGDTLTASVGCYLAEQNIITDQIIIDAVARAIEHCQEVIQVFGTAKPSETIRS